ncbi:MAG TPA: hypothetical protein VLI39_15590 [Sedimentisphaerales bacterium]|nr:hypothetical protein [Sedimentisphaerales bacterium]
MVEILKSFEQVASRFSPAVLVLPGLTLTGLGLVTWLAGMCRRRLIPGLAGALTGGLAMFFVGGQNLLIASLTAGGIAAFAAGAPRLFVAVVLALLGVSVGFGVQARGQLFQQHDLLLSSQTLRQTETRFTVQESLDVAQAYVLDVVDVLDRAIARQWVPADLAALAGVGAGLLIGALLAPRMAGALTCSLIGSGLVFAGLTLLLIYKGSTPVARMEQQSAFYGLALLGMGAFGTLEQLLLCPPSGRDREGGSKSRSRRERSKEDWRNR